MTTVSIRRPHQSPTATAYRATPQATDQWAAEATLADWERKEARRAVADTWMSVFCEALDPAEAVRVRPHRSVRLDHREPDRRRHHFHWLLSRSLVEGPGKVPYCHVIASDAGMRGHAPDLRTRVGRAMQADLDTLEQEVPVVLGDHLLDLPGDGSTTAWDRHGRLLGRDTLLSETVAPGCRYVIYDGRPAHDPDPQVWTPVPVAEYLAVRAELEPLLATA